MEDVCVEL
jgi:hypothetical protein